MDKADLLARLMAQIGHLAGGPLFEQLIQEAEAKGAQDAFIHDARALSRQLAGDPNAGAVDCIREVARDLKSTEAFVDKWGKTAPPGAHPDVLELAIRTTKPLREMNAMVDGMSSAELADVRRTAQFGRMIMGRPPQRPALWAVILPLFVVVVVAVVLITRQTTAPQYDELGDFAFALFTALKANDIDRVVGDLCVNKEDCDRYIADVEARNEGVTFDVNADATEEGSRQSHREAIGVFLNSYRDLLNGEPASWSTRHDQAMETDKLIIWVETDGKYRGIAVESIIKTDTGYKVNDWLGPIAVPRKRASSLRKKRAVLASDTAEDCDFPRSGIIYEYSFDE